MEMPDLEEIDSKEKMKSIIEFLNYHTKLYETGHPEISDYLWDKYYYELQRIEDVMGFSLPESPTQKIVYDVVNKLNKVEHSHPMLSLDKTKSIEDVKSFIGKKEFIAMPKLDGLTCSLTYKNGELVKAETRGNGLIGEDILHNAVHVHNIPKQINYLDELIIDGEIICTRDNFKKFEKEYKNSRNFASGSIRVLDSKECEKRNLSFIAWDLINLYNDKSLDYKLMFLICKGFDTVFWHTRCDIEIAIEKIKDSCQIWGWPIDGIVFKYNNCKEYEAAGRTDHHFKGGLAYKFYDEEYETILRDIEWTMGRTGQLTPVAIFDTIDIDGSEVSRASLHNISVLEETLHGPGWHGQKVYVSKMNMIIPQIINAEEDQIGIEKEYFSLPQICPVCGQPTEKRKDYDSEVLYCGNTECEGKILNRLDHFCSKKGLDIKGLSKATLEKLMDWGWVEDYYDIFTLNDYAEEWMHIPGFGQASVHNILAAIDNAKETALDKIIAAAGIPEIGSRVSKDLSQYYDSYTDFRAETNFLKYDGIGEIMQNNLLNFNYNDLRFDETVKTFLKIKEKEDNKKENNLENKVFCITGKTHIFKNRAELTADIENKGGKVVSSMSSKVHYLINNDATSTSAKNQAAKSAGIPILTEEDYLAL